MANVLLVDDYRPIRQAVSRYLRLHGHTVTEVANLRSALERAVRGFDVIITALTMPGSGGAELIRALRSRNVTTPVIVISGQGLALEETVGVAWVLPSPFEPSALVDVVSNVLSTGQAKPAGGGGTLSPTNVHPLS